MNFTSFAFVFYFLPVVILLSLPLRRKLPWQNILFCIASLFFYAWGEPQYVLLLLVSTAGNFCLAVAIDNSRSKYPEKLTLAKCILAAGISFNLSILLHFKYAAFFSENFSRIVTLCALPQLANPVSPISAMAPITPVVTMILPLGISFFTFHGISYLVDVYRARNKALLNPATMLLYITFFPQLIAGPIIRYHEIAQQLTDRRMTWHGAAEGGVRFVIGLAKKVVIADQLSHLCDTVFNLPVEQVSTIAAWIAAVSFTFQIYFDFSGYTDMACGLAKIFGFTFPENFNYPYMSQSIRDFWRRWHMSLSTFFRDYVYLPLGGSRVSKAREYANLVIVFLLCGLWHGASWTFVYWGLFHGLFLCLERTGFARLLERCPAWVRHCYALLVVIFGWMFFRAADLPQALSMVAAMFGQVSGTTFYPWQALIDFRLILILCVAVIASTPIVRIISMAQQGTSPIKPVLRFAGVLFLLFLSISEMQASTVKPFLYFRF